MGKIYFVKEVHVYLAELLTINAIDNYIIRVGNNPNPDFNPVCGSGRFSGNQRAVSCNLFGRYYSIHEADARVQLYVCELEAFY